MVRRGEGNGAVRWGGQPFLYCQERRVGSLALEYDGDLHTALFGIQDNALSKDIPGYKIWFFFKIF